MTDPQPAGERRYVLAGGELCAALFDTQEGTGVCEAFGPHDQHGGVVKVGAFLCHRCRRRTDARASSPCRCDRSEASR